MRLVHPMHLADHRGIVDSVAVTGAKRGGGNPLHCTAQLAQADGAHRGNSAPAPGPGVCVKTRSGRNSSATRSCVPQSGVGTGLDARIAEFHEFIGKKRTWPFRLDAVVRRRITDPGAGGLHLDRPMIPGAGKGCRDSAAVLDGVDKERVHAVRDENPHVRHRVHAAGDTHADDRPAIGEPRPQRHRHTALQKGDKMRGQDVGATSFTPGDLVVSRRGVGWRGHCWRPE